ncbi:MAG: helix-turn-helix domain-containing protein [Parcubacteria group bacterium]
MSNKKKHLSFEERFLIEKMLSKKHDLLSISNTLDRSISTISLEIRKNGGVGLYSASEAQNRASVLQRKKKSAFNKVMRDPSLEKFVVIKLKENLSPEHISILSKSEQGVSYVSPKSIRKYIKSKYIL